MTFIRLPADNHIAYKQGRDFIALKIIHDYT